MATKKELPRFMNLQKAVDYVLWHNFMSRTSNSSPLGVVQSCHGDYLVVARGHPSFEDQEFEALPDTYSSMDYTKIASIKMQQDSLEHWNGLSGMLQNAQGELLRFILEKQVPIEKWIRYELACRGYNKNCQWVGFNKAKEIWLVD